MSPPQEVKDLAQRSAAVQSSIPFKSQHPLSQPMYEAQLKPSPGEAPAAAAAQHIRSEPPTAGAQVGEPGTLGVRGAEQDAAEEIERSSAQTPGASVWQGEDDSGDQGGITTVVIAVVGTLAGAAVLLLLGLLAALFAFKGRRHVAKHQTVTGLTNDSIYQV